LQFPILFPSIRRFFYGARVQNPPTAMRKCFSTVILLKRCTREKCETVSYFSKRLSVNVLRMQKRIFLKNEKPYRKFFCGTDLWLNRGREDGNVDVRIEDLAWERLAVRQDRPAGTSCSHLCPLASPKSDEGGSADKN
jgi:hypothetical protein